MDEYTVALDPETKMRCTLYAFADVENTEEIRKKVINGDLHCCIVKLALIVDPFQAVVAANKAALNAKSGQLTTKSLYTEILFCLSTSKNISRSLAEFGIHDTDKNILVISICKLEEQTEFSRVLADNIKGRRIPISKLTEYTDFDLVRKTYKIEKDELNISSYSDSVISRISSKDFTSLK